MGLTKGRYPRRPGVVFRRRGGTTSCSSRVPLGDHEGPALPGPRRARERRPRVAVTASLSRSSRRPAPPERRGSCSLAGRHRARGDGRDGRASRPGPGALQKAACAMPRELVRVWRGTHAERSGQILLVPQEPNFLGRTSRSSGPLGLPVRRPLLWYGPANRPRRSARWAATRDRRHRTDTGRAPPASTSEVEGRALPEIETPVTPPKLMSRSCGTPAAISVSRSTRRLAELKALTPAVSGYRTRRRVVALDHPGRRTRRSAPGVPDPDRPDRCRVLPGPTSSCARGRSAGAG